MTDRKRDDNTFTEELERQKINALAEFAAGAGHEINNPLTVISGHAQYLLQHTEEPDERYHLGIILAQTKRAYEMIADIRTFARPPIPQYKPTDIFKLLSSCLERQQRDLHSSPVKIEVHYEKGPGEELPLLDLDSSQIETILGALIKNSVEALLSLPSNDNGDKTIHFEGRTSLFPSLPKNDSLLSSDNLLIEKVLIQFVLEDNGPGISPEDRENLFTPYWSGRSYGRGLGFGLSKVYRLLQGFGGTIQLEEPRYSQHGCRWKLEWTTHVCRNE